MKQPARERGSRSKEEDADPKAKGKGKDPKKDEEAEVVEEVPREYPKCETHQNLTICGFLHHFESERLIMQQCSKIEARKRDDREKEEISTQATEEADQWSKNIEQWEQEREQSKAQREGDTKSFKDIYTSARNDYKKAREELLEKRNWYRNLIDGRKNKEIALLDVLALEKIEVADLETALAEAKEFLVREDLLKEAEVKIEKLKYSKGVEEELQQATADKDPEKMRELIEKIENEQLIVDQKMFDGSKAALAKMK